MNDPKIVAAARETRDARKVRSVGSTQAWAVLGWAAFAFLLVGGSDFVLAWVPPMFGNQQWEFGTVTATFNGLPIVVLSIALLLAASMQVERRWWSWLVAVVALVMFLWILGGAVLWATDAPLAARTIPDDLTLGLKKALVKTGIQAVVYPVLFAYLFWRAQRAARGVGKAES